MLSDKLLWLSSLRGLMVFFVFLSHQTYLGLPQNANFVIGRIGVVCFFLMTGYLAVTSLYKRSVRQYVFNRFLRIYPIFWLLVIATWILLDRFSLTTLIANMTLFHQFMGYEQLIGASWMLPIMVVFFGVLVISKKNVDKYLKWLYVLFSIGALLFGGMRYVTGKPFPTAFFLLQLVGIIGYYWKQQDAVPLTHVVCFEIVLVVASFLSYGEKVIWYFVAYNIGGLFFGLFMKRNLSSKILDKFGSLGFTFFLGADIPSLILRKFDICLGSINPYWHFIIIFCLTLLLSYIITKWIETPLLAWGKKIEKEKLK